VVFGGNGEEAQVVVHTRSSTTSFLQNVGSELFMFPGRCPERDQHETTARWKASGLSSWVAGDAYPRNVARGIGAMMVNVRRCRNRSERAGCSGCAGRRCPGHSDA
jgi:hypothetical protein